ncbi:MAG: hypothetical protein J5I93_01995, partial [Pirellulaceae bacterium]|nr:hypothetical protein [Pirellulaceae bacterium]
MQHPTFDLAAFNGWGRQLAEQLQVQRQRAEQLLQEQSQRVQQAETSLEQRALGLAERLRELNQQHDELQRQQQELARQQRELLDNRREIDVQREESQRVRQQLDQQRQQLEQQREQLDQQRQQLEQQREQLDAQRDQFDQQRQQLDRERCELDTTRQAAWASQQEWERRQEELLRRLDQRQEQLELARERHDRAVEELLAARQGLQNPPTRSASDEDAAAATAANAAALAELATLRASLEKAQQELEQLRHRNAALVRQADAGAAVEKPGALDWEAEKRRLLARLEAEFDEHDPHDREARLTIEGAIRITDEVVMERDRWLAERDAEIDALRQQVRQLQLSSSRTAGGHDDHLDALEAGADGLDAGEPGGSGSRERDKLRRLQLAFQDKLRQAEVEIAVERAKLARERSELESRVQMLVARFGDLEPTAGSTPQGGGAGGGAGGGKPGR